MGCKSITGYIHVHMLRATLILITALKESEELNHTWMDFSALTFLKGKAVHHLQASNNQQVWLETPNLLLEVLH